MGPRSRAGAAPVHAFATRLIAIAGVFGLAVLVELRGLGAYSERQLAALYALVLVGFLLALAYGALAAYGHAERRLAAAELIGDGILITGFVYCSGGVGSLFSFLYIVWIVHAAVRAGSRGAALASGGAIAAYGVIAWGMVGGWLPAFEVGSTLLVSEAATAFGIHTAAFLSVALLSQRLERQVKLGQDELMELGEIHQRIVDNVSSGLLTVDRTERISSFNREAERITGFTSDEVLAWPLERLFPTLDEVRPPEGRQGSDGVAGRPEVAFVNRAGERLHLGLSRSVLRDSTGAVDGAIVIFQDLTRVREMEEQLRRSERLSAVGQLAAGLAHEIRNPLASLSGAIELLGADLPASDASSRRLLRIVERETARLDRLVSDFLSYARSRPPRREPVPLRELFEEIQGLLAVGGRRDVELVLDVPSGLSVRGDSDQLRQVFWNLILNAAEAGPSDHRVHARAQPLAAEVAEEGGRVQIEVIDRGMGIPEDQLERAFEPFFTTKAKGAGLGLATVHRLIEAHGGELSVRSEVSQGTTVRVVLEQGGA